MQGSTSPSKNGESPNSAPQVTFSRRRLTALRACSHLGSSPRFHRSCRVCRVEDHTDVELPSPQVPSVFWSLSSWAPHPTVAIRDRSAATASADSLVRSRMTCQRIDGSESSSHFMTAFDGFWICDLSVFGFIYRFLLALSARGFSPCVRLLG